MHPHCDHRGLGFLIGAFAALTALFWWTFTDRLDLPKQWILLIGAIVTVLYAWIRLKDFSPSALLPAFVCVPVFAWLVASEGMGARVEGWAGWIAAIAFTVLAANANVRSISKCLFPAGVCVAGIAWLQALGVAFLNHELTEFSGRRVVSTLGGPGHLGWWTAATLPWALLKVHETADNLYERIRKNKSARVIAVMTLHVIGLALITGAWIFSGTRTAWAGGIAGIVLVSWKFPRKRFFHILAFSGIGAGLLSAVTIDAVSEKAGLRSRIHDLGETRGTARGRMYLWKVHLSSLGEIPLMGGGPEAFQRLWPRNQERYLRKNPKDEPFRSDLRHAHADPVEIFYDFGILGLILGIWVLIRLFKPLFKPPGENDSPSGRAQHFAATASALSLLVCGLGAPVLFFAPTLFLGAIDLGISLRPDKESETVTMERSRVHSSGSMALTLLGLGLAMAPLTIRLVSEMERSRATIARHTNNPELSARLAKKALETDPRNPRASMELAMAMERLGRFTDALRAWKNTVRDLPTDAVQDRIVNLIGADLGGLSLALPEIKCENQD